jgi:hypothetical protein
VCTLRPANGGAAGVWGHVVQGNGQHGRINSGRATGEGEGRGHTWAVSVEWDNGLSHVHYCGKDGSYNLETAGGGRRTPHDDVALLKEACFHKGSRVMLSKAAREWSSKHAPNATGMPMLGRVAEVCHTHIQTHTHTCRGLSVGSFGTIPSLCSTLLVILPCRFSKSRVWCSGRAVGATWGNGVVPTSGSSPASSPRQTAAASSSGGSSIRHPSSSRCGTVGLPLSPFSPPPTRPTQTARCASTTGEK